MNFLQKSLFFVILSVLCSQVNGQSVTIQIKESGFQNGSGVVTNGMAWGLVVDTTSAGFAGLTSSNLLPSGSFPSVDPGGSGNDTGSVQLLSFSSAEAGLYFFRGPGDTENSGPPSFQDGFINEININVGGSPASPGDSFGLIWFPNSSISSNDPYGFESLGVLPAGGSTTPFAASVSSTNYTVAVPEPSHFALAFGLIGLGVVVWRRRRKAAAAE